VGAPPTVTVKYTGCAVDVLQLEGDAETRVTKLAAWLAQNGLVQSGKTKDAKDAHGCWVRTLFFSRADVPF
jgi:hypothetical protein